MQVLEKQLNTAPQCLSNASTAISYFLKKSTKVKINKNMCTLLEVRSTAASDEQSIPSESHTSITQHQGYTPISVSRCFSHTQMLDVKKKKRQPLVPR